MDLLASVANKRLTTGLSPLDATLTKNRGEGGVMVNQHPPDLDVWTFRRSDVPTFQRTLHSLFSLFAQRVFHNSFTFTGIHTLSKNSRGVPQLFPFWNSPFSNNSHESPVPFSLPFNFQLAIVNFLRFKYRIGTKHYARPAPIGPL